MERHGNIGDDAPARAGVRVKCVGANPGFEGLVLLAYFVVVFTHPHQFVNLSIMTTEAPTSMGVLPTARTTLWTESRARARETSHPQLRHTQSLTRLC